MLTAAGPADPIAAHERLAARLGPSDAGQLAVQQIELDLEVVDQPQGQLDRLTSHRRELGPGRQARPSAVSSWERSGSPWWNKIAWMRCCQPVRSPTRARRSRTWVRASAICAG